MCHSLAIAETTVKFEPITPSALIMATKYVEQELASDYIYWSSQRWLNDTTHFRLGLRSKGIAPAGVYGLGSELNFDMLILPNDGKEQEWFTLGRPISGGVIVRSRANVASLTEPLRDDSTYETTIKTLVRLVTANLVKGLSSAERSLSPMS